MGDNNHEQLSIGNITNFSTPQLVSTNVVSISSGQYHSLFVKDDNAFWAMGYNPWGALGDGTQEDRHSPVEIQF